MGLWPMWSFPSAACLGPNPDTLETEKKSKTNKESWESGEKEDTEKD